MSDDLRNIYFLLLRSTLEYSSGVFVHLPCVIDDKLRRFQNRVHELICSIPKDCRATDCACQAFPDLRRRRLDAAIRLFRKAAWKPSHPLHKILPPRSSRSGRFLQPPASSSRRLNSFVPFVCTLIDKPFTTTYFCDFLYFECSKIPIFLKNIHSILFYSILFYSIL